MPTPNSKAHSLWEKSESLAYRNFAEIASKLLANSTGGSIGSLKPALMNRPSFEREELKAADGVCAVKFSRPEVTYRTSAQ